MYPSDSLLNGFDAYHISELIRRFGVERYWSGRPTEKTEKYKTRAGAKTTYTKTPIRKFQIAQHSQLHEAPKIRGMRCSRRWAHSDLPPPSRGAEHKVCRTPFRLPQIPEVSYRPPLFRRPHAKQIACSRPPDAKVWMVG